MKLIPSCLVLFSLLIPLTSQAMYGSSYNHIGGGGGYYGGGNYQAAQAQARLQAMARQRQMMAMQAARAEQARAAAQARAEEAARVREARAAEEARIAQEAQRQEQERIAAAQRAQAKAEREALERRRNERSKQAWENYDRRRNEEKLERRRALIPERQELLTEVERIKTEVNEINKRSQELYSKHTRQMGGAASKVVRDQLGLSTVLADDAVSIAELPDSSPSMIKLYSDLALDTANSVNNFLGGVAGGVYDGFLTAAQAGAAILQDPTLVLNLSNNIVHTLSEGPQGIADAAESMWHRVVDEVDHFNQIMAFGDAGSRGRAIGNFGANLALAMSIDRLTGGIRPGMRFLNQTGDALKQVENRPLGEAINRGLRENAATAPLMEASDARMLERAREAVMRNFDVCLQVRNGYRAEVAGIRGVADNMLAEGNSEEVVARHVHGMRREMGQRYKDLTPEEVREFIYGRNLERGADPLGPTIEELRAGRPAAHGKPAKPGKTWAEIIESASKPNRSVNAFFDRMMEGR